MKIDWSKEERRRIGEAVIAARNAGTNETDAAAQAAVAIFLARASGRLKDQGEAFATYHAEQAKHGGASWEFHARAETWCRTAAALAQESESLRGAERAADEVLETIGRITAQRAEEDTISAVTRVSQEAESLRAELDRERTISGEYADYKAASEKRIERLRQERYAARAEAEGRAKVAESEVERLEARVASLREDLLKQYDDLTQRAAQSRQWWVAQRDAWADRGMAAETEVERLKAELSGAAVTMKEALVSANAWHSRASAAESRLATVREALDAIRDGRRFRGEHLPEAIVKVALTLEGDAPNSPGFPDGSTLVSEPTNNERAPEVYLSPQAVQALQRLTRAAPTVLNTCICQDGTTEPCLAQRHPCSPTCTHDDAATPGHPERVKERSEAVLAVSRADHADGVLHASFDGYDQGVEDMRAACWEAVVTLLVKHGLQNVREEFKRAIEGVTP